MSREEHPRLGHDIAQAACNVAMILSGTGALLMGYVSGADALAPPSSAESDFVHHSPEDFSADLSWTIGLTATALSCHITNRRVLNR